MAGVIQALSIIEMIDGRILPDDQAGITTGAAVAGMTLHGLGFADRPISLTPPLCANKPVALLVRAGVSAEHCNRFTLGRSLDKVFPYGGDTLCSAVARAVCTQEGMALQCTCRDPTSVSLPGAEGPATDTQAMAITHGSAKEHRPEVQQAVLAWRVSHDGGVPFLRQSGDGKASATGGFKERGAALGTPCAARAAPRYVSADATVDTEAQAGPWARLPLLPRIPETLQVTQQRIAQAWAWGAWQPLDETVRDQRVERCHDGMAQRGLVVSSQDAWQRAASPRATARAKEAEQGQTPRCHLQAQRFPSETDARATLERMAQRGRAHQVAPVSLTPQSHSARTGRPTPATPTPATRWHIHASVMGAAATIPHQQQRQACVVLGTTSPDPAVPDAAVVAGSKGHSAVERGWRFLNDPVVFVSSRFVNKPSRIQGLLMVMTLALVGSPGAQRRRRSPWARPHDTLPTQIGQPTSRPTLRWLCQLLEGLNRVTLSIPGHVTRVMEGLTALRRKILQLVGQKVCQIYHISPG